MSQKKPNDCIIIKGLERKRKYRYRLAWDGTYPTMEYVTPKKEA
ncbi:hypothetical protein D4764_12G0008030 [Takifugu flavidus]|uniref:Uncharacterized protein n=1 Tax=Takifugu flavidus TaxID=433684 RepID=A0A5C6PD86_9TELE|nr:hypothetical protein D4764_12G0008030 [Takifugu flavidus]